MDEVLPVVLLTVGVGVVLLVALVVLVVPPVRRFTRTEARLRAGVAEQTAALRELSPRRRRRPS